MEEQERKLQGVALRALALWVVVIKMFIAGVIADPVWLLGGAGAVV